VIEAVFRPEQISSTGAFVVKEKVRSLRCGSETPSVRLLGKPGSALPPSRKYFDLDLDEYQLD
jgi:hypothetical protein